MAENSTLGATLATGSSYPVLFVAHFLTAASLQPKYSGGAGFAYKDSGLLPDGIKTLKVMSGEPGRSRLTVKGGGLRLPDPPMPFAQDPTIIVQVVNGVGRCWGASFVVAPQENSNGRLLVKERP